jgi:hypothetical protein
MMTEQAALNKDRRAGYCEMQHRHFAAIAAIIAKIPPYNYEERRFIARHFAEELSHTNPNFDRDRFLKACDAGSLKSLRR